MYQPVSIAQDRHSSHRKLQKVVFEAVFLQHLDITILRLDAARPACIVGVGHDGEQGPHHTVLVNAAALALRFKRDCQPQGLPVGQLVELLANLCFHKFRRVFHGKAPPGRVIYHRQTPDYAFSSHKTFFPSERANCTMLICPSSARANLSTEIFTAG